jgi:cytosine deaminase
MKFDLLIRNARLRSGDTLSGIGISKGKIAFIGPAIEGNGVVEIDAGGKLTTSAFVNPHFHLDKALLGEVMEANRTGTFQEALETTWEHKKNYTTEGILKRATRALEMAVMNGTVVVRAFADVDNITELKALMGLMETKEACADIMDLQIVPFPQEGIIRHRGAETLMCKALELGVDAVGGFPWIEESTKDAEEHIDIVFDMAKKFDLDIHMLVDDDPLDSYSRNLEYLAIKTYREDYLGRVTVSHACAMSSYNDAYAAKLIRMVKRAGISVVANPHISLMIKCRHQPQPISRGITRVKQLLEGGVNVVCGQDDLDDPYYPMGKMDMLEVASYMAHTAHLSSPSDLEKIFDMLTTDAARALKLKDYGLGVGCNADIVIIDARNAKEAIRFQPPRSYVIKAGRIVVEQHTEKKVYRQK